MDYAAPIVGVQPVPAVSLLRPGDPVIEEDLMPDVEQAEMGMDVMAVHPDAALHPIDRSITPDKANQRLNGNEPQDNNEPKTETADLPPWHASHCQRSAADY